MDTFTYHFDPISCKFLTAPILILNPTPNYVQTSIGQTAPFYHFMVFIVSKAIVIVIAITIVIVFVIVIVLVIVIVTAYHLLPASCIVTLERKWPLETSPECNIGLRNSPTKEYLICVKRESNMTNNLNDEWPYFGRSICLIWV